VLHILRCNPLIWPRMLDQTKRFVLQRTDGCKFQTGDDIVMYKYDPDKDHDCSQGHCTSNYQGVGRIRLSYIATFISAGWYEGVDLGTHVILSLTPRSLFGMAWPGNWRMRCGKQGKLLPQQWPYNLAREDIRADYAIVNHLDKCILPRIEHLIEFHTDWNAQ
jgi:hypothetical protein